MSASGLFVAQPIPIARSILWKPLPDSYHLLAKVLQGAEEFKIFIAQRTLLDVEDHVRSAGDREVLGLLLGNLFRDPVTGERYVVANATLPSAHPVADDDEEPITPEVWEVLQEELRKRTGHLLGWYRSRPTMGVRLEPGDTRTHEKYFPQPWQTALILAVENRRATGGVFLVEKRIARSYFTTFYELLDSESIRENGLKRTCVSWYNYITEDTVAAFASWGSPPGIETVPPARVRHTPSAFTRALTSLGNAIDRLDDAGEGLWKRLHRPAPRTEPRAPLAREPAPPPIAVSAGPPARPPIRLVVSDEPKRPPREEPPRRITAAATEIELPVPRAEPEPPIQPAVMPDDGLARERQPLPEIAAEALTDEEQQTVPSWLDDDEEDAERAAPPMLIPGGVLLNPNFYEEAERRGRRRKYGYAAVGAGAVVAAAIAFVLIANPFDSSPRRVAVSPALAAPPLPASVPLPPRAAPIANLPALLEEFEARADSVQQVMVSYQAVDLDFARGRATCAQIRTAHDAVRTHFFALSELHSQLADQLNPAQRSRFRLLDTRRSGLDAAFDASQCREAR